MSKNKNKISVYKKFTVAVLLAGICFMLFGCFETKEESSEQSIDTEETGSVSKTKEDINNISVREDKNVYMFDDEGSVVTMYLTVRRGNSSENTDHSWSEVNSYSIFDYERMGVERYGVEGILKVGDDSGPVSGELGFGVSVPNAIVHVRGNTTSREPQKSYKIELKRDKGTWREQRTIALNKHPYDETRVLNKLCYDLMKDIPEMISARTQFVHLYVKDETGSDAESAVYEDYGLFTQVEQFNGRYLENHRLDKNGHFYKAEMFEFLRYEDEIKLKSDTEYDIDVFEDVLEIKGNDDHTKLISMLDDINNYSLETEEVFEKYFDEENYFAWMAFNILVGNIDTINRNFYLYSPLNSEKWYIIPWDNDGAFSRTTKKYRGIVRDYGHELGISNYWGCVLHQRVLSNAKYLKKLDAKIEELKKYLSKDRIMEKLNVYKSNVKRYMYSMPDIMYINVTEDKYNGLLEAMLEEVDINYKLYKESLECPMPFHIDIPQYEDEKIKYSWGVAYDFDGEDITYSAEISKDLNFTEVIAAYDNISIPIVYTNKLETGQYFIRVKAKNASGKEQYAFDYYTSENGKNYGIYDFYIQPDGTINS